MEENIMNNTVEMAQENLEKAAEALDNALATQAATQPKGGVGMNLALGIGCTAGGFAIGIAVDHWLVPKAKKAWENHKAKKAAKKAEKAAKKAAKPAETPAKEPVVVEDGIDPTEIDVTIQ